MKFYHPLFIIISVIYLSFHSKPVYSQDSLNIVSDGEYKRIISNKVFDTASLVKECALLAQSEAIEKAFGKVIYQKTTFNLANNNVNDKVNSSESFNTTSESNLMGRWVRDISPPLIEYYLQDNEHWISIKVKGYVREIKPKSFNEDREAMAEYIKKLYLKMPFSDITIVENYNSRFLISVVELDKTLYQSTSDMNRVASIKAKSQLSRYFNGSMTEEIFVIQTTPFNDTAQSTSSIVKSFSAIKESSSGWVNAMELLNVFPSADNHHVVYVYSKFLEAIK